MSHHDDVQACTNCLGTGTRVQKTASLMPSGKMEETVVVYSCDACLGSGWLHGRSQ